MWETERTEAHWYRQERPREKGNKEGEVEKGIYKNISA